MKINEIAFAGYSVADMKRAKNFYEGVLGLKKTRGFGQHEGDDMWVEYDIGTGCLALIAGGGKDWPPGSSGVAVALEVDNFEASVAELKAQGVKFVFDPYESPVCWMVVINDPDGNRLVLHKRKSA
jgi:predicted enzyme related to lactoylglutathione lyase